MKRISIIGSTGSIGTQALEVIEKPQDKFEIIALAGGNNIELLKSGISVNVYPEGTRNQGKEMLPFKEGALKMAEKKSPATSGNSQLDAVLSQIRKQFGETSIQRLGDGAAQKDIPVISTGSFSLDLALGVGGVPRGRVTEIYGPESSGKTTLALHVHFC